MKFSENWLRANVATTATRDELTATLTAIGLEVEGVTPLGESLAGVVVGRITSAERHPEADRLQVCQVDVGQAAPLQIVCGAPNARAGLCAPLATVGATLPGGLAIKAAKLRGVESAGMLCSAKELGIDADASGLLELPADATPGTPLTELLELPDATIEVKLTPNRADCFSVRGIAFDVAAALGSSVSPFDAAPVPAGTNATLPVQLAAGERVPRFVGRVIEGVDATVPTPAWMSERLRRSGIRPISLLVDVTQYVMLELGQPMHAFDRDALEGGIAVRPARAGEALKLLDGRDVELDEQFLVVSDRDGERAVALGGIMGGFDTRVTDATRNVFLEAAHWVPEAIIGRSRRLGLHTDAGHRFERGVDPELPRIAVEYATRLITTIAGGTPGPTIDTMHSSGTVAPKAIALRRARLQRVIGMRIDDAEVERILRALGLDVQATADGWQVTAPTRRFDIAIEEDLVEEVARIHGFDRIPATLPAGVVPLAPVSETRVEPGVLRRVLVARGFTEAINYAFVDAAWLDAWGMQDGTVALANPLSAELAVMRPSLLPGLLAALGRNVARQQAQVRLFEAGNVFQATGDAPRHVQRIAAVACGPAGGEHWAGPAAAVDFFAMKGDLEALAAVSRAPLAFRAAKPAFAHPGRSADVLLGDRVVGWIGQLHPTLLSRLGVEPDTYAFEVDLAAVATRELPRAQPLSRFPSVRRDLAVVVPDAAAWGDIAATVREAAGRLLQDVVLFDVYRGKGVEGGHRSLAMGLILQEKDRTLTDAEVDAVIARVLAAMHDAHRAVIRA